MGLLSLERIAPRRHQSVRVCFTSCGSVEGRNAPTSCFVVGGSGSTDVAGPTVPDTSSVLDGGEDALDREVERSLISLIRSIWGCTSE